MCLPDEWQKCKSLQAGLSGLQQTGGHAMLNEGVAPHERCTVSAAKGTPLSLATSPIPRTVIAQACS